MSDFLGTDSNSNIEVIDSNGNNLMRDGKKPVDKKDMIKNVAIAFL